MLLTGGKEHGVALSSKCFIFIYAVLLIFLKQCSFRINFVCVCERIALRNT